MTDTSQGGLKQLQNWYATSSSAEAGIIIILIDALEAARALQAITAGREDAGRAIIAALEDALEAARAKIDEMDALLTDAYHGEAKAKAALRGLVDRLDEIHADPAYKSAWIVNQIHAGPYIGPTYVDALAAARAALEGKATP